MTKIPNEPIRADIELLIGKYTFRNNVLRIYESKAKTLEGKAIDLANLQKTFYVVKPSKFPFRPDYLQRKVVGCQIPFFISSCYEPRTDKGLWNIEVGGTRIEAIRLPQPECIELATISELRQRPDIRFLPTNRKSRV